MQNDFIQLQNFIEEMKSNSSVLIKKEILLKYDSPFLRKIFEYTYSPFKQYHVTSANLKKRSDLTLVDNYNDLFLLSLVTFLDLWLAFFISCDLLVSRKSFI